MPTPPVGQGLDPPSSQSTSIRSAILFRSKQDERSVDTTKDDSSPKTDQGSIFEGVLGPPASKPDILFDIRHP